MRVREIFVLFALIMIVQGACAWWAAAGRMAEPILLSFGAVFAAIGLNDQPRHDVQLFSKSEASEPVSEPSKGSTKKEKEKKIDRKVFGKFGVGISSDKKIGKRF